MSPFNFLTGARRRQLPTTNKTLIYAVLCVGPLRGCLAGTTVDASVFVIDEAGPVDPNLYREFENGGPNVSEMTMDEEVLVFLYAIWPRYRDDDPLKIDRLISRYGNGEEAVEKPDGSEIPVSAMMRMFARESEKPDTGSKMHRTATGKAVKVTAWTPPMKVSTD
jgi:hypothetical protein